MTRPCTWKIMCVVIASTFIGRYLASMSPSKGPSKGLQHLLEHPFDFIEWQCWKRLPPPFQHVETCWKDVEWMLKEFKSLYFASTCVEQYFCSLEWSECWNGVEVICPVLSTLLSKRMHNEEDLTMVTMVTMNVKTVAKRPDDFVCGCSTSGWYFDQLILQWRTMTRKMILK